KLIYLPPYSPGYNPIEMASSLIKAHLRRHTEDLAVTDISEACYAVTPQMAEGCFKEAGYI
ncbi:uncharacterized protein TRAVEDRAFT_132887, partial [Trametes versicolor FP-101664 SS1]|uniref:uncharacterized protein n=1 Tax=Trametes versicolor (strain FP-101664) TaxID=717944 RepID=UPI0004624347